MAVKSISQKKLKKFVHYDPDTGIFTRLVSFNRKAGSVCMPPKSSYLKIQIDGYGYLAHRLAFLYMEGMMPSNCVDHINHDIHDNRWNNLRHAERRDNQRNRRISANNKSGHHGVRFCKSANAWEAYINHDGEQIYLGISKSLEIAINMRKQAEAKYQYHPNHGA